jgi:aminopeptidase N
MLPVGSKTYVFKLSDPFSTYLFSFVAGKFKTVGKQLDQWPMNFYFRETDSNKIRLSVDTIFGWHRKALNFLEEYTQIKFPFQKLDFVAIPDFQYGGMEHVGAIDYRASSLFLDSGATKEQENGRGSLIAHETSHMWFGDLVTMKWFNDVWMKEVFANFMADKITKGDQASNNYELRFLLGHFPRAYSIDRTAGANPIRQELPNLQEAGSLYGPIIYDKAPVMMRQLERLMGEEAFRQGLRIYLKKYSFANATWPDLIHIFDSLTPADLQTWNKVWVNTAGRPIFTYSLEEEKSKIKKFTISQRGETATDYFLPQIFEIALVYSDRIDQITLNMNKPVVELNEVIGKPIPEFILFNSSGQGYGVFPIDKNSNSFYKLNNPLMRASAYINLYENMLSGNDISPSELMKDLLEKIDKQNEPEELILSVMTNYVSDIYWRLITSEKRKMLAAETEGILWKAMQKETVAGRKKILFRTFQNIALSKKGLDTLYAIWKNQKTPAGVRLSPDEYSSIAQTLAIKKYPDENILQTELQRISNPDRKLRFEFLMPVLCNDVRQWDNFFASLKDPAIRKKESWVGEALGFLNHPLRQETSIKYLSQTLEMLEDVQKTGDIFFPAAWLSSSFGSYQSGQAATIVRDFLKVHPNYNLQLKLKILQAADPLFRAEKLIK